MTCSSTALVPIEAAYDNLNELKLNNPVADFDDDSVSRKSAPSTIVGQEGSVRAKNHEHKIHEHKILEHMSHEHMSHESKNHQYIRKQIAEALFEYDKEHHRSDSQRSTAASITFNIDIRGISAVKAMQDDSNRSGNILSVVNSSIGPVTITHSRLARYLQLSIMALYTILLVASAFLGPKTLALAVWRMAIGLGVYAVAVWRLGWAGRLERDVLLAPVFFAFSVAQGVGGQLLEKLHAEVATAISGGPKRIEGGEGVRFDDE
ncbi:hypothetical protein GMOD_00002723 [Pyrenophora seminiperda CCB06]|uniref:Uncharacterized protein n=1 Tax=Pyrenophora seminiperda CCB06 TaxID=1302712 RepID=A0A3M7M2U1_9PLEO|nr:hypothetical protein GMOD_00002723 [Pyrenophora seminiperda CCB06]